MNKKRGMSIAAVLAIMICLISLVTTVFLVASRNSSLTSKSLRYIESYNEASTSIDNSVDFIVDAANKATTLNGTFVLSKIEVVEGLFGVDGKIDVVDPTTDLSGGFLIEFTREYEGGVLYSAVSFSPGGASGVITPELLIDKETIESVTSEDLLKEKFNSTNLMYDYWVDQIENGKNTFISMLDNNQEVYNQFNKFDEQMAENSGIVKPKGIDDLVKALYNAAENASMFKGTTKTLPNGIEVESRSEHVNDLISLANNNTIVIDENTVVNNEAKIVNNDVKYKIIVKDGACLFMRSKLTTNADVFVEKGSTILLKDDFTIEPYKSKCPIVDLEYTGLPTYDHAFDDYVGGGLITLTSFRYELAESNVIKANGYVKGAIFAGKYVNLQAGNLGEKEDPNNKLPIGVTAYAGNQCKLMNVGFYSTNSEVRPTFIFSDGEVYTYYVASLVNGIETKYINGVPYDEDDYVGFGIITCSKVQLTGDNGDKRPKVTFPVKMNLFYNSRSEMENDGDKGQILVSTNAWLSTEGVDSRYNVYNALINNHDVMKAAGESPEEIARNINDWYIPPKLRGQMQMMATQAVQSRK